jgi:hypothetical protein
MTATQTADLIMAKRYPDVSRVALMRMHLDERQLGRFHYGTGPSDYELQRLGCCKIGETNPSTLIQVVRLTEFGHEVAMIIKAEWKQQDAAHPIDDSPVVCGRGLGGW